MALIGTEKPARGVEQVLGAACARNLPAELHFEAQGGFLVTARVRMLELAKRQILCDRPSYTTEEGEIPPGEAVTVHLAMHGSWYQFDTVIEKRNGAVRLNARQTVPGIALKRPLVLTESQRRTHLRVSMLGYDPINVDMVRHHPELTDATPVDAKLIPAWLVDLSVGGISVLVDRQVLPSADASERFFVCFELPLVAEDFIMLTSVRHGRVIESSESLRLGLRFCPWRHNDFTRDQQRLARFIAQHERRLLRRRR